MSKKYTNATPQQVTENLLNPKFRADAPNEKWLTDVTKFKYGNGPESVFERYSRSS
ncbi:hypothetical protein [Paenibacillus alvei]|uniref:Transposase n=1 Tax=Paenibacillus alvei TaxID=44250 RepID=A0AAP6ZVE8_PAEAL|nr:hypothetical protein [Paenibacillus alvei]MCY9579148.1 hypothetical protein [Paenibacillus alvei]MCY9583575.1 hypothetical protein [Paenibacillus alvei]NOJ70788.1 hypothetical protein [Paenibacillus alvei]